MGKLLNLVAAYGVNGGISMVTMKWINVNGTGYYEVSNGISSINCDESDLRETIAELEAELRTT